MGGRVKHPHRESVKKEEQELGLRKKSMIYRVDLNASVGSQETLKV